MRYIGNALSLGMLDFVEQTPALLRVESLTLEQAREWIMKDVLQVDPWESCVGHADTALLLSALLRTEIPLRRVSTSLQQGDELLVAQYNGPRLPEGATSLPDGARIRWMLVFIG
jgi:hypothetical protein